MQSLDCSEIHLVFSLVTSVRLWDKNYVACPQRSNSGRKSKSYPVQAAPRPIAGAVRDTKAQGDQKMGSEQEKSWRDFPGAVRRPPQLHWSLGESSWSISPEIFGAYSGPAPGHLHHSCTVAVVHPLGSNWADWGLERGDWAGCISEATWEENLGN